MEADRQGHLEPVHLRNDSSDEHQMAHLGDKTELDTGLREKIPVVRMSQHLDIVVGQKRWT